MSAHATSGDSPSRRPTGRQANAAIVIHRTTPGMNQGTAVGEPDHQLLLPAS